MIDVETGEILWAGSDLEKIIRDGMAAPTAVNRQLWSFIVISDRNKLDELAAGLSYANMPEKAGAAIIVCAEPPKAAGERREFVVIDASLASENILP